MNCTLLYENRISRYLQYCSLELGSFKLKGTSTVLLTYFHYFSNPSTPIQYIHHNITLYSTLYALFHVHLMDCGGGTSFHLRHICLYLSDLSVSLFLIYLLFPSPLFPPATALTALTALTAHLHTAVLPRGDNRHSKPNFTSFSRLFPTLLDTTYSVQALRQQVNSNWGLFNPV